MTEEYTPLTVALSQLKLASEKLGLDSGMHKMLLANLNAQSPSASMFEWIMVQLTFSKVCAFSIGMPVDPSKVESVTTQT